MRIGIGLPISRPDLLTTWATTAETAEFSTLALLDRLVYDNPEPLVTLGVLAGVTRTIGLQTEVLLGPLRQTALLAKQVATLDLMSGGRFALGIGVGGRADDHRVAATPKEQRGRRFTSQLAELRRIWSAEADELGGLVGPTPNRRVPILIGGFAPAALARVAEYGDGYICAAPAQWAGRLLDQVREGWRVAGRDGRPRIVAQINVAIGPPEVVSDAEVAVRNYYEFTGRDGWGAPETEPGRIRTAIGQFSDLGVDEVVLYCYGADPHQVDRLAQVVDAVSREG